MLKKLPEERELRLGVRMKCTTCPVCGAQVKKEDLFCGNCGAKLERGRRRSGKAGKVIRCCAAVLLISAALFSALSFAAAGSADRLGDWFSACRYLISGNLYSACPELETLDGPLAPVILGSVRKTAYRRGVRAYRKGEYGTAGQLFSVSAGIKDSDVYEAFSSAHIPGYYYNDITCEKLLKSIRENWELEDAPDALVSNNSLAKYWLNGRWETSDGNYYLELDAENLRYNLPHVSFGDTFKINSGYVIFYFSDDDADARESFRLYPMDMDTVSVYCISDNKYYNLYRKTAE